MFYLKVSNALKTLVSETADAFGTTTAAIMRKVALKIAHKTLEFAPERDRVILRRGDNVTATVEVPVNLTRIYSKNDRIKAEMNPPEVNDPKFRLALAAACLDTMNQLHAARMRERFSRMDDVSATMRSAAAEVAR